MCIRAIFLHLYEQVTKYEYIFILTYAILFILYQKIIDKLLHYAGHRYLFTIYLVKYKSL